MSYGFYLSNGSEKKTPLRCVVRNCGKQFSKIIIKQVDSKSWDQARQRFKGGNKEYNILIANYSNSLDRVLPQITTAIPSKQLWEMISADMNGEDYVLVGDSSLFLDYFRDVYIPRFKLSKSFSRIRRFKATCALINNFEEFKGYRYAFDEIDIHFYRDLGQWFTDNNYSTNYFGSIIKIIKQVMREAATVDRVHNNMAYNSADFKSKSAQVDNIYLTDAELRRLYSLVIDEDFVKKLYPLSSYGIGDRIKSFTVTRNLFLIGAYTGLRYSDFSVLESENFADGKITVVTQKTGARVVIPVHPIVQGILDCGFSLNDTISDQKLRIYIKELCKVAGIDEVVTVRRGDTVVRVPKYKLVGTHTARRSFATNAYKASVPTLAIMQITGHKKESDFMRYIKVNAEENAERLMQHPFFL
ncbi:MAG: tyrosine-type recombinase/integrase [Rikenellaceae bacterium]